MACQILPLYPTKVLICMNISNKNEAVVKSSSFTLKHWVLHHLNHETFVNHQPDSHVCRMLRYDTIRYDTIRYDTIRYTLLSP